MRKRKISRIQIYSCKRLRQILSQQQRYIIGMEAKIKFVKDLQAFDDVLAEVEQGLFDLAHWGPG